MDEIKCISYADWISLISSVIQKGLACDELKQLKEVYPYSVGESYDGMIYNQIAKLEEYIIQESINTFQKRISLCMEEMDLEVVESAFTILRKHLNDGLFFLHIPNCPELVKEKLFEEIQKNVTAFTDSFLKYLRKIEYADSNLFIQDFVFLCKKRIRKINEITGV